MNQLNYPGTLLDDELGYRLLKCYVFKFIRHKVLRRPRFDVAAQAFTHKQYFWFHTKRPLFGDYHRQENRVRFSWVLNSGFLAGKRAVFFMPQYSASDSGKHRKTNVYCCSGAEVISYLDRMEWHEMQNFTLFDSSFDWALDIFEDLVPDEQHDKDVVIYFRPPARGADALVEDLRESPQLGRGLEVLV